MQRTATAGPERRASAERLSRVTALAAPSGVEHAWPELEERARERGEPLFRPCRHHVDDRGSSLMNLLGGAMSSRGQLNYSVQWPGVIKAWHRHDRQTDFWLCLSGHLKIGVWRESDGHAWTLVVGERRPGVVVIPPPLWHGAATVGPDPAGLLYYVTERYDADAPDEHRRAPTSVVGFPWAVEHR